MKEKLKLYIYQNIFLVDIKNYGIINQFNELFKGIFMQVIIKSIFIISS